jgi:GT2 family glycosyltransferase
MTIGLVIVTYQARSHIVRCLEAVAGQSLRPERIVLVDNASTDGTLDAAREAAARLDLPIEVIALECNEGFARANNRAVAALDGCEGVALLNPDAFPEPGWLAALVAAARAHPEAGSFASCLLASDRSGVLDGAGDAYHASGLAWRYGHARPLGEVSGARQARPVFSACAAAALYRRSDWVRAGGFDERYFCYMEDVDLGFRLQLLGRGCVYQPEARAVHVGSAASGVGSPFSVYHGHRNLEWTFVKNMPGGLFWRHLPAHLVMSLASVVWFTMRGRGWSIVRAKWDAMLHLGAVVADRRRVQRERIVTPEAIGALFDRSPLWRQAAARAGRP